ncbi:MAG: multidrug effflux MFS transporter [Pseudomonadota bacterium]
MTQTTSPTKPAPPRSDLAQSKIARPEFIALLAMLMALNALAIDIMLPAFPNILGSYAGTPDNRVQLVLTAYLVGFGFSQLLFGPLSDRFGRRAPLFFGMAIYILFAFAGALAPSLEWLLVARFLQGVGAAATRTIALAVVRDTHSGRAMASTMSLIFMVFMSVPIFAPIIGQIIIIGVEWQWIFVFMGVFCAGILVWAATRMPETLLPENRRPLTFTAVRDAFGYIFANRQSLFYGLSTAFFFGSLFSFLNVAQPIFGDVYGLGALFPLAFAGVAVLMSITSFANSRLVLRIGQRRLAHAGLCAFAAISALHALIALFGNPPFWLFMIFMSVTMPLFGLIGANLNSLAMEPMGKIAGTASSVFGFGQSVLGSIIGAIVGQQFTDQIATLLVGFAVVSTTALVCVLVAERGKLFGTTEG